MESYILSYSGVESRRKYMWFCLGCEKEPGLSYSYGLTLSYEIIQDIGIFMRIVVWIHIEVVWQVQIYVSKSMHGWSGSRESSIWVCGLVEV